MADPKKEIAALQRLSNTLKTLDEHTQMLNWHGAGATVGAFYRRLEISSGRSSPYGAAEAHAAMLADEWITAHAEEIAADIIGRLQSDVTDARQALAEIQGGDNG